ncbi:hypothetical protein [Komagataeibacter medellinensis]|uniref:hypothetical protein n=1 Tax=Komagataeibacter medellinensis TaxID=1177712 RepID=UPI0038D1513A
MTDALGNLVRFTLISGQHYDTVGVAPLLEPVDSEGILADKAFDVHWIVDALHAQGTCVVIPQRKNRIDRRPFDGTLQGTPSHRERLLQAQGVQAYRHAKRED